jgi:hypothetical protein
MLSNSRPWFAANAATAWIGLAVSVTLTVLGTYPSTNTVPSQLGSADAGLLSRVFDNWTYFTIWSNAVVGITLTLLAINPARDSPVFRVLRLDGLLMISVTGLVYAIVLAPTASPQGWEQGSNFFLHQLTPVLTLVVWGLFGPRRWINWRTIGLALLLPIVWLVFALTRGAIIGAYPYPFLDVIKYGYGAVLINVLAILILGVIIMVILMGVDRLLSRGQRDNSAMINSANSSGV